jgi:hypothetical protein
MARHPCCCQSRNKGIPRFGTRQTTLSKILSDVSPGASMLVAHVLFIGEGPAVGWNGDYDGPKQDTPPLYCASRLPGMLPGCWCRGV